MEHYWEIERLRALQEDTPHIWAQQSCFMRPVVLGLVLRAPIPGCISFEYYCKTLLL